ncbi:MAG: hypothetical protein CVV42_18450 [Candidatus Riflebacteria bacterium HGW-Riflebacteria-2]|jgi:hypothetical protein|nr:MAG: hypothetical protein CVV42_18450 [Candidatus Riflebacteria bacterium HGW-Riflebacteria-2]
MNNLKKGMVLPVVVLFALLMGIFIATMAPMGQSTRTRIQNLNKNQACFFVAQAAYAELLADIHRVSWQNRSFKDAPHREIGKAILNGDYDLHVENTPNAPDFYMDIYIRSRFNERAQLYFWRVLYRSDLLDISNRHLILHHARIRDDEFPATDGREFAKKIDKLLETRKNNEETSNELSRKIREKSDIKDILDIIKAPDPEATNTDEFKTNVAQVNTPVISIPPIQFPSANSEETDTVLVPKKENDPQGAPAPPGAPVGPAPTTEEYDPAPTLAAATAELGTLDSYLDFVNASYMQLMETIPSGTISDDPQLAAKIAQLLTLSDKLDASIQSAHAIFDKLPQAADNVDTTQSANAKSVYESILDEFNTKADSVTGTYQECVNLIDSIRRSLATWKPAP